MTSKETNEICEIATVALNVSLKVKACLEILEKTKKDAPHLMAINDILRQASDTQGRVQNRLEIMCLQYQIKKKRKEVG
jgi:hypothetical protein